MQRLYFDNNATTALDPRVVQAMLAEMNGPPANSSSIHSFGRQARASLAAARKSIASFFHAKPDELIFTSGGTEGINMLLRGFLGSRPKGHLITTAVEHSSVYHTLKILEEAGLDITYLPVGPWGAPTAEQIQAALKPDTRALVLAAANGETGVKLPLESIAALAYAHEIPLLLDAVAYIGKEALPAHPGISALAFSAHKFHGPKGVGGLIVRNLKLTPLFTGGGQEYQRRAGTENLTGILGLSEAIQILRESGPAITSHLLSLRSRLEEGLRAEIPDLQINGDGPRIANTVNIAFPGVDGETLLMHLDMAGVAVSHGSACASGALEPSRVLLQMGLDARRARTSIRFSLSRFHTTGEIDLCIARTAETVRKIKR